MGTQGNSEKNVQYKIILPLIGSTFVFHSDIHSMTDMGTIENLLYETLKLPYSRAFRIKLED